MGWIVHHAVVVTSYHKEDIDRAYERAREIFSVVSPPLESVINGYWSFFIPPDGSKEGWAESDTGDAQRKRFAKWVRAQAYEDGSNSLDAVEVAYGEVQQPVIVRVNGKKTGLTYQGR